MDDMTADSRQRVFARIALATGVLLFLIALASPTGASFARTAPGSCLPRLRQSS